jgi:hypothetical protein
MRNNSRKLGSLYSVCCLTLLFACAFAVIAQSGRRARQSSPQPAPTPEATPTPAPPAEKQKPAFTFIVGTDQLSDGFRVSLAVYSGLVGSCGNRLNDAPAVQATISERSMSRFAAISRAKAEKEAYVIWLQLRSRDLSGRTDVSDDPNNLYLEYSVFAPVTAKVVNSGETYPAYRTARIRLPRPATDGDYYLNQAARDAAERILSHFHQHPSHVLP